jgi:hypothetical protein
MARPSKTSGKTSAAKTRKASSPKDRKPGKTKHRTAPTAIRSKHSSVSGLGKELKEAREQQAAAADILKVIASSPDDVQPAFEAIAASARRLMGGYSAGVFRFIDGVSHLKAFTPTTTSEADEVLKNTFSSTMYSIVDLALSISLTSMSTLKCKALFSHRGSVKKIFVWDRLTFVRCFACDGSGVDSCPHCYGEGECRTGRRSPLS